MEKRNEKMMKAMPWLLIFGGFFALTILPAIVAGGCILLGIIMLIEKLWPEEWSNEKI